MSTDLVLLSRNNNSDDFEVVFRHPALDDPSTGRPGRRIRCGLRTDDEHYAQQLVTQLERLLSEPRWWTDDARESADRSFDARVVTAFYNAPQRDPAKKSVDVRQEEIPLPTADDGYRHVLLIGTTGAGKTTLIRQLLGTDPDRDRFPSTSTAKTTVADTEIIIAEGDYHAVVTFFPRSEIQSHLLENASRTASVIRRGGSEDELRTTLLDHENQRFRFSYILGRLPVPAARTSTTVEVPDEFDEFDEFDVPNDATPATFEAEPAHLQGVDLDYTSSLIKAAIWGLQGLVREYLAGVDDRAQEASEMPSDAALDDDLDSALRDDERFNSIVDSLLEDILKRFTGEHDGVFTFDDHGWPLTWQFNCADRGQFLRAVNRFTSNYAPLFGHLLTPLVDGIRVCGPFRPTWHEGELPKLVLMDGEGLGHTAKSSAALPTAVAEMINKIDGVLLVDNAQQPMQAAPAAAIRSILTSGNIEKLIFCFTHFEEVQGDNLTSARDRAHHVIASVDNLLGAIRKDFGSRAEHAVRERLASRRVFLSRIDRPLSTADRDGRWSIAQMQRLFQDIRDTKQAPGTSAAKPAYDTAALTAAIEAGTRHFHRRWGGLLGTGEADDVQPEHWARVKALTKRFADGSADQYDTLRPNADLREMLKEDIYKVLELPERWIGSVPSESEQTAVIDSLSHAIAIRLEAPIRERLSEEARKDWQTSFSYNGTGSTVKRARHISDRIFAEKVTVPATAPEASAPSFLEVVVRSVNEAAAEVGVQLD